jgi:hypothetical protein
MSTLSTTRPTLIDHARAFNDGKLLKIANILQEYNEILDDVPMVEANQATGHVMGISTSKPTPYFRLLNQGVVPQKATSGQISEGIAMMENRNQIDVELANLNGASAAFRMSQDKPMIEGFSDLLSDTLISGDSSVSPEQFNGFYSRYFTLGATYTTSSQMIDAGGTGSDNTSILIVCWEPDKVYGIYPKGSKAGLDYQDLGIQQITSDATTGARLSVYESLMKWKFGLAVQDYRYVVRICNIDVSNLLTAGDGSDTSANLEKLIIRGLGKLPPGAKNPIIYCNETVQTMLSYKIYNKGSSLVSWREIKNTPVFRPNPVLHFQNVPVRRVDSIGIAEAQITLSTV